MRVSPSSAEARGRSSSRKAWRRTDPPSTEEPLKDRREVLLDEFLDELEDLENFLEDLDLLDDATLPEASELTPNSESVPPSSFRFRNS